MDFQPIVFVTSMISAISLSCCVLLIVLLRRERVGHSPRPSTGVRLRRLVGPTTVVEGYDNGVLCLSGFSPASAFSASIQLWNPSRKQLRQLPPPPATANDSRRQNAGFRLGVGRDPLTSDLKVVRVCSPTYHGPSFDVDHLKLFVAGTEASVYSQRENSWRAIEWVPLVDPASPDSTIEFSTCYRTRSVVVNSCVHWSASYKLSRPGHSKRIAKFGIFAFDLATEAFRLVPPPREVTQVVVKDGLARWSNRLALVVRDPNSNCAEDSVDIWVMKHYNDSTSWIKQVSFNFTSLNLPVLILPFFVSKIELANNGHAQISTIKGIIHYDLNTKTVLHFGEASKGFPTQEDISPSDTTSLFT